MAKKVKIEFGGVFEKLTPVLLVATIGMAFAVGILWEKVRNLEVGGTLVANNQVQGTGTDTNAPAANAGPVAGKLSEDQAEKVPSVTDADNIRGSKDADVVIVEYSDYECPFCKQFHPTMKQALAEYGDRVAWVYRHFPLTFHPRANPSANAAECVADLAGNDAFWKFTDLVFEDQVKYLTDSGLKEAAVSSGVNSGAFDSCYTEKRFDSLISTQTQSGTDAGITGTPGSFVINKKGEIWLVGGAVPYESLKTTIDEALAN